MPPENDDSQNVEDLIAAGLTVTQAKVYLGTIRLGRSKAKVIWKMAGVSRQDVYRILTELEQKGLIIRILGDPVEFEATPIQEAIKLLLKQKNKDIEEIERRTRNLLSRYMTTTLKEQTKEYWFNLKPAKAENEEYGKKRWQEIKTSFCFIGYWASFNATAGVYFESMKAAMKRGIKVRFITESPKEGDAVSEELQILIKMGAEIRFNSKPIQGSFMIADLMGDKEFVRFYLEKTKITTFAPSLTANNQYIVSVFKDYFELLWSKAEKYRM